MTEYATRGVGGGRGGEGGGGEGGRFGFLAHRIRIFEILLWDRKFYLTYAILPRLSRKKCSLVVLELTHMVVK